MLSEEVLTQLVPFTTPGASVCGVSNNGFILCFSSGGSMESWSSVREVICCRILCMQYSLDVMSFRVHQESVISPAN